MRFIDDAKCYTNAISNDTIRCDLTTCAHARFDINVTSKFEDELSYEEHLADAKVDLARVVYGEVADKIMEAIMVSQEGRAVYDVTQAHYHNERILRMLNDIHKQLGVNG